jgi:hypothetical protein
VSNYTGSVGPELYYSESIAGTALATFTAEASLMGAYPVPQIPAAFFAKLGQQSSSMKIRAYGNVGDTTAAPTFTLSARLLSSSTTWSAGGLLLGSTGATSVNGTSLTNGWWQLDMDVILKAIAAGAATSTLSTYGVLGGPGFSAPGGFMPANNVSADNATFDNTGATQYYFWLSAACSVSNAANKIQLQGLKIYLEN